jgi:hypothetical protein
VIRYLNGVEQARRARAELVDIVRLTHRDGHETLVLWARTAVAAQVEISATAEKAQLIDQYGNMTIIRPVNGYYALSLPAAKCNDVDGCPVGGSTYLLVQPAGEFQVMVNGTQMLFE